MGQITYGIMFGCRADAFCAMSQGGWEIVDAYVKACRDALRGGPLLSLSHSEDGDVFVGFWIAVGATGKPDVPFMPSGIALDQIECTDP